MKIDVKDITVVVQGPIIGSADDLVENRHTYRCLKSIRSQLPGATIVLSTWDGSNTKDLDYDVIVMSKDPGYFRMWDVVPGQMRNESANRQIVSTLNGLKKSTTKFAIKMRSDLLLKNTNFLHYYREFQEAPFDTAYQVVTQRVLMLTTINPKRKFKHPFSMSDWFYFGLTSDLVNMFEIPLMSDQNARGERLNGYYSVMNNFSTEQYLWFSFLSKYRDIPFRHLTDASGHTIELSERYLANNAIILSARRAGLDSLKYPGGSYAQIPCLSYSGLYTFNEYKQLLNKYSSAHLRIIPNVLEILAYFIVYHSRFWIKKQSPRLHDFIARVVNPKLHKEQT